ncbi:ABC transporter ATP-binding protein [Rhabdaerophilum sp. SD176]|uniref:ABC transporter ATP-binding protein n=1 Tax=Rhabdaerophilum sp. SD176 TaxID=2983548 RepID=UPI0024E009CE|nr:ABC transporter ATP-binding protein [Rhabdaerophilum sp. SD176]
MARKSLGNIRRSFAPWADPAAIPQVRFESVTKRFDDIAAVSDLTLSLYPGEFHALLGPSGCGKTTLMRMLAGFETPDSGRILLDGQDLAGIPPHLRPTNMMFQSYALFPHMSVFDNIAFGLRQGNLKREAIAARVAEMLALVKLEGFAGRRPDQLSGGQKQRVALARALARQPKVLLLDEPLGALDKKLREETQYELMDLQAELGLTFLMVTHDQDEAMAMADRISVMERGRIAQVGAPEEIYEMPANRYVAEFVGDINVFEGVVDEVKGEIISLDGRHGPIILDDPDPSLAIGQTVSVAIRPEKISITLEEPAQPTNKMTGEIWDIGYLGDFTMVQVKLDGEAGQLVRVALPNRSRRAERPIAWEDRVWLSWDVEAGILLRG